MSFGLRATDALDSGFLVPDPTLFWKANPDRARVRRVPNLVHPDAPIPQRGTRNRVIVLGDSCSRLATRGLPYSASLETELGSTDWEVFNASVPGYSSYQGLLWLRSQLLAAEPDLVVIYFGWNDHWRTPGRLRLLNLMSRPPDHPPLRVPLEEYRDNLRSMIDDVVRASGRVVLVAAPFRFPDEDKQRYVENAYLLPEDDVVSLHQSYLDVVREFVGEDDVTVLGADLILASLGNAPALLRDDGIHFTPKGHRVMGAVLAEQIRSGAGRDGTAAPELLEAARRVLVGETRSDDSVGSTSTQETPLIPN